MNQVCYIKEVRGIRNLTYGILILLAVLPRLACLILLRAHENPVVSGRFELAAAGILRHGFLEAGELGTTEDLGYPLFLAFLYRIHPHSYLLILLAQILIAGVGAVFFYKLCMILSDDRRVARIGFTFYSLYPYWVYHAAAITEVTLATAFLVLSVYYFVKSDRAPDAVLCGIAFGLAVLCRAPFLAVAVLCLLASTVRGKFVKALLILTFMLLPLAPAAYRGYQIDGSFFSTRGGENLFKGNCEYSDRLIPAHNVNILNGYMLRRVIEERPDLMYEDGTLMKQNYYLKGTNDFFAEKAFEFIRTHPWRTLKLRLKNVAYLFYPQLVPLNSIRKDARLEWDEEGTIQITGVMPKDRRKNWVYALTYGPILFLAMMGIYLRRREFRRDTVLYLVLLSFIVVYSLYWPATRTRAPMDFVLMFFAAFTLSRWLRRGVSRKTS